MAFWDFYKIFTYAFTQNPLEKRIDIKSLSGAGVSQPDAIPDLRGDTGGMAGGSNAFIRVQNDLVDLTTTTNRQNRYKEYDRLAASVPEIDMAMTVFADEACIAGSTEISTVFHGPQRIDHLAKHKATERFPVYCYDFDKQDYSIGWAFAPRFVKKSPTIRLWLEDGSEEIVTPDHRILKRDEEWAHAEDLRYGDHLMPFYRVMPSKYHNKLRTGKFPRIFTLSKGWVHERQFIDEWRLGRDLDQYQKVNKIGKLYTAGIKRDKIAQMVGCSHVSIYYWLGREGFTPREFKQLGKKQDYRRIIGIEAGPTIDVFDLSVEHHKNFCTKNLVMHNCQKDDDGKVFKISCANKEVTEELNFMFFHRGMINMDQRNCWDKFKRLCIKGDEFWELVINADNPKEGVYKLQDLPPESMYRIETTKGKILEFQQGKEGPDYQSLQRAPILTATEAELSQATAIRFAPEQVVHLRIGDYRKTFYPYGVSLIEAARGPAHQLRMMEDSMVVYRLVRAPERRIFYIDVGQLPPFKAEAFIDRLKDQFRKKKVVSNSKPGASGVEERWHAPAQDEDYWVPIRPNSATKIDTLPGAENLGEIDDTVYFRNKLFTALNFPKNYFSSEDPNATRITLSAQDVKFARMIERLQSHFEDALWEVADRHLKLRGFPAESYEDLNIKMTPPSDWRQLSRAEVTTNMINNANALKGSQIISDYDILRKWMDYEEDETNEMISRMKLQKLEDLKLQVLAQNPRLLGIGIPGEGEPEVGAEPGGPTANMPPGGMPGMPGQGMPPEGQMPPGAMPGQGMPPEGQMPQAQPEQFKKEEPGPGMMPHKKQAKPLPDPTDDDIIKYDLEIQDYDSDMDMETPDFSEVEG